MTYLGVTWEALAVLLVALPIYGFGVTGGYHRLFAHASYEAHGLVRASHLFFGAGCFENSALKWSEDHRRHHAEVDTDEDPYNIKKGFWWAHIGWIFFQDRPREGKDTVGDLKRDWMVRLQHRFYIPIALLSSFGLPLAVGWLLGDPWGGLILGGFVRLVVLHHTTFCINSLAHTIGSQTYSDADSSRDSAIVALITLGEGYHNFHHTFPFDYRNGVRAYHFDPTKWGIRALSYVGLVKGLVRAPYPVVLKTRVEMMNRNARPLLDRLPDAAEILDASRRKLEALLDRWSSLKAEYLRLQNELDRATLKPLQQEIRRARQEATEAFHAWRLALREPQRLAA